MRAVGFVATAAVVAALALAGCSPIVALDPAPDAASPACAEVSVRLPSQIGGLPARETNAQATGAWGDPTVVVLHCGVPSPPPTSELPCATLPDLSVDWLIDDSDYPIYVFTSYGRTPAVSVVLDYDVIGSATVLDALDDAVSRLPKDGSCI